jgi:hypothetical protein
MQEEFYKIETKERIQKLLMFSEIIAFHALLLLMNSDHDINDFKIYEKEFERLIKRDFTNERTAIEKKLVEEAEAAIEAAKEVKEFEPKAGDVDKKMEK